MDTNVLDSGGRVTRSLRKRLTSIDSDNSSRPGTPLSTKLASITEISTTPSKSTRSTRRNSVSDAATPVKTPAKRGIFNSVIPESAEMSLPARSTRRRSAFAIENDQTSQAVHKIPTNEVVDEKIVQDNNIHTIITRSKSRSPQQPNMSTKSYSPKNRNSATDNEHKEIGESIKISAAKKRKPGPKSKTCEKRELDNMSEVEINVLQDEFEDMKVKSSNITTVVLTDDDSTQLSNNEKRDFEVHKYIDLKDSAPNEVDVESINRINIAMETKLEDTEPNARKLTQEEENYSEFIHDNIDQEFSAASKNEPPVERKEKGEESFHDRNKDKHEGLDMTEIENELEKDNKDSNADSDNCKASDAKEKEVSEKENGFDRFLNGCINSEKDNKTEKVEILSVTTNCSYDGKAVQKKVDFISSPSNDTSIKTVYPKTPASTKAAVASKKIRISLENFLENQDVKMTKDNQIETNTKDAELPNTGEKTPTRSFGSSRRSEIMQNSSPVCNEQDFKLLVDNAEEETSENVLNKLERSPHKEIVELNMPTEEKTENDSNQTINQDEEELKWINPSAIGNTEEGSKLDMISTNANHVDNILENILTQSETYEKSIAFSSEDEFEIHQDENDYCEEEYEEKHDYIDNEAVEVENYESGDSMNSEDRAEIELNEIPIDGESVGSQTTEESDQSEHSDDEDSDNSFIVSDNENVEHSESGRNEDEYQYENKKKHKTNKKIYNRIRCASESSSSDEVGEQELENEQKEKQNSNSVHEKEKDFGKDTITFKSDTNASFNQQNVSNKSCNDINLDSSKLSESALRLHFTSYSKSDVEDNGEETNISHKEIIYNLNHSKEFNKSVRVDEPVTENDKIHKVIVAENNNREEHETSLSSEEDMQNESKIGKISITPESDDDKENNNKSSNLSSDRKHGSSSSKNCGEPKEKMECQRSFTIDVTFNDGELETKLTDVKPKEKELDDMPSICNQENETIKNKDPENIKHIPLLVGNPLIRTRHQSLALPTNPDMEICSSSSVALNKKIGRKSLGMLSNIEYKPSQSFIENIELLRNEKAKFSAKRKRLSKSFDGSGDQNMEEVDVRCLHKTSKLVDDSRLEESDQQSADQIDLGEIFTEISSTPHESKNKNDSYNTRILRRCDEILDAANRAKLEAKMRNRKNKTKTSKKWKKKSAFTSSEEISPVDKVLRSVHVEIKRKDKTKTAVSKALMAADTILNKPKISTLDKVNAIEKTLKPDVETIQNTYPMKKRTRKEINHEKKQIPNNVCATSAGNFMEFSQTPEKKKKVKYIQLPTGKISVEPITPKKSLTQASNGRSFRESPSTPYDVGFRVKKISSSENNISSSNIFKSGKRKRCHDESLKNITRPNAQWTQSGLFTEEIILNRKQCKVHQNFKENALSRPDINRSTKRELLLIRELKRASHTKNYI